MTISKLIKILFDEIFPVDDTYTSRAPLLAVKDVNPSMFGADDEPAKPKKAKDFNTEEMMHYLMLGGMVQDDDVQGGDSRCFTVRDEERKKSWTLRYIMMWCALQIMFCQWNLNRTGVGIKHHRSYMDHGIMDFYTSLWFYALHCLNYSPNGDCVDLTSIKREENDPVTQTFEGWLKADKDTLANNIAQFTISRQPLEFEEFHYYYASILPFYIRKYEDPDYTFSNLSNMVFSLKDLGGFSAKANFDLEGYKNSKCLILAVQKNISLIYQSMFYTWNTYVSHVSTMIHQDMPVSANPMYLRIGAFFAKPSQIVANRAHVLTLPLDIQSFNDHLSSFWYWFHFKHITMPQIRKLCKDYDSGTLQSAAGNQQDRTTCVVLWRRWFQHFDSRVRSLGAGAVQEPRLRVLLELRTAAQLRRAASQSEAPLLEK